MAKRIGLTIFAFILFIGIPFLDTLSDNHKAARQFVVQSPEVKPSIGTVTTVILFPIGYKMSSGDSGSCRTYTYFVNGSKGMEWMSVRTFQPDAKTPWTLVELREGTRSVHAECPWLVHPT